MKQLWRIVDDDDNIEEEGLTQEQAEAYLTRSSNCGVDLYMQEMIDESD